MLELGGVVQAVLEYLQHLLLALQVVEVEAAAEVLKDPSAHPSAFQEPVEAEEAVAAEAEEVVVAVDYHPHLSSILQAQRLPQVYT